jgi:NAD(P)-dependent dehydrogenase (short-subunit alcohol dehydrogenase family)
MSAADAFLALRGQRAIVTGASRGIGAATAVELARHGVSVLLLARNVAQAEEVATGIRAGGGVADAMACDVSSFSAMQAAVQRCIDAFGGIDILINNAGVIEPIGRLAELDPDDWDRVIDVNLKGAFHAMRAVLPPMLAQRHGVIVNISSGAATGVLEGWSHYCASKHGVLALTRAAHLEYHEQGIRTLGLVPGTVATHMQVAIKASGINPVSEMDPSAHQPPEHTARALAWLCTDDASDLAGTDFSLKSPENRRRAGLPM